MRILSVLVPAVVLGVVAASCGSDDEGGAAGAGASPGSDAGGQGGTGGVIHVDGGAGNGGTTIGPDATCATETVESSLEHLAMYFILDRSQSMVTANKWNNARDALSDFVDAPAASGIRMALQYFPLEQGECDGSGYSTPEVSMSALTAPHADRIKNSLAGAQMTTIGTPTEGALNGIAGFCTSYAQQNPTDTVVGVLITDGEPNGCDENPDNLAAIAASAFGGSPSIPVFVIGMEGAVFTVLHQIAASGGTNEAFDVAQGGAASFLNALQTISGTAMPCQFAVPTGTTDPVDPAKVNVKYTNAAGEEQYLGQVDGSADCVPNAWYYDDAQNPTQLILCPGTCSEIQAQASGTMDIVLGCETIPPPPPR